jgi:hypothetical protein
LGKTGGLASDRKRKLEPPRPRTANFFPYLEKVDVQTCDLSHFQVLPYLMQAHEAQKPSKSEQVAVPGRYLIQKPTILSSSASKTSNSFDASFLGLRSGLLRLRVYSPYELLPPSADEIEVCWSANVVNRPTSDSTCFKARHELCPFAKALRLVLGKVKRKF